MSVVKHIIPMTLAMSFVLTGCSVSKDIGNKILGSRSTEPIKSEIMESGSKDNISNSINLVNNGKLLSVSDIKAKYDVEDNYIKPFYNVSQNTEFKFHFNSLVEPYNAITVHTDPKCELNSTVYQISDGYIVDDEMDIIVKPGKPVLNSSDRESGEIENYNWGYAPVYYLCIRYDMYSNTVKELDNPIIVPFTIKNNISTPNVEGKIDSAGNFKLTWKPVENAVKYNIYSATGIRNDSDAYNFTRGECGYSGDYLKLLDTVDYSVNEYSKFGADNTDNYLSDGEFVSIQNFYDLDTYYITAVDAEGNESLFSMAVEGWKQYHRLPNEFDAYNSFDRDENYDIVNLPSVVSVEMKDGSYQEYPISYTKIGEEYGYGEYKYNIHGTMLSGDVTYKNVDGIYPDTIESDKEINTALYEFKNNINIIPDVNVNAFSESDYGDTIFKLDKLGEYDQTKKIRYSEIAIMGRADIEAARMINDGVYPDGLTPGSMFDYEGATIIMPDGSIFEASSDEFRPSDYTGDINDEPVIDEPEIDEPEIDETEIDEPEIDEPEIDEPENPKEINSENLVDEQIKHTKEQVEEGNKVQVEDTEYPVFADSAAEEYLALQMINGVEIIDLKAFPELQNTENLIDVLYKVHFQNPYHLGFTDVNYNYDTQELCIEYTYDDQTLQSKQEEIRAEADSILKSIITDSMSDEEKVLAIWNYLEDNTSYDMEALNKAQETDFTDTSGFEDSFNAYGIINNKVGVCQSYAYAFQLLGTMSGLDTKVVTGYINGNLPHGWNVVKLDDDWYWIDTTNNEKTSGIPYMLYQTSSDMADKMGYDSDDRFDINNNLDYISNMDNSKDWHVANGNWADNSDELISLLVDNLNKDGYTVVKSLDSGLLNSKEDLVELAQGLLLNGLTEDDLYQMKLGYCNGYYIMFFGNQ